MIVIVMGVAGSGKSTVGTKLAAELGWEFIDGDGLHAPESIDKMRAGKPLTDADRSAWLALIAARMAELDRRSRSGVVACSALREAYRRTLAAAAQNVRFVHLKGSYELIRERIEQRQAHFMKTALLRSQFETLEEPKNGIAVDVTADPDTLVKAIRRVLSL